MDHTTVRAKVHRDNTGIIMEIPVIITEAGPLNPLLDFLLEKAHGRSFSWMQKMTQAVGLLLDYMDANHGCFEDPKELFQTFVQRLYTGTVGEDGLDPSGLFWFPKPAYLVRQLTNQLSDFSDWMAERLDTKPLNPWRDATRYEEMLNWAAYYQKHGRSFLGHTWYRERASEAAKRAKNTLLKRGQKIDYDGVKFFPDDRIMDLLFKGFIVPGKQKSRRFEERLNLRDILITVLMHFGGVRVSESFHLYVHDVLPDPLHPERAMVRIYHPSEGLAPNDWHDAKGKVIKCNRDAYLRGKYAIRPRDQYFSTDQLHAGWKGNLLDSKAHFMHIHWFPTWSGELFLKLWNLFLIQRALKDCDHPFAFVTEEGKPYAVDSFVRTHARAVERIGLTPAKILGTTPHGHRHAFGQRMTDAGIDPIIIKKALHHKSLESQVVYTEPQVDKVTQMLDNATKALNNGQSLPPPDVLKYGFEDVDPMGFLSGSKPKLRRP
jgi:site-specific recombinase XerD